MRALQSTLPAQLTRVSDDRVRDTYYRLGGTCAQPLEVWESQEFLVQLYPIRDGEGCHFNLSLRMTVNRVTGKNGRADDGITWDDLQRIKREIGHGETYAVEVYPRDSDVINVANMRHLWLCAEPLDIGWFARRGVS